LRPASPDTRIPKRYIVSDLISTKGRSKPSQVAFIAAVALVALAMLASVLVSRDDPARQNASSNVAAEGSPSLLFFDPGELAKDIRHVVKQAQRRTCSPQYDYPGCTPAQQDALENPDRDTFAGNYDKGRWGQGNYGVPVRNQWDNLTDANNDKMRRLYADAVQRFESGSGPEAEYQTWAGFKNNMQCGGSFGAYSGLVQAWCLTTKPINWVVEQIDKLVMGCQGLVIDGLIGGGIAAKVELINSTVKIGSMQGAALAAIGCAVSFIRKAIEDTLGKGKVADAQAVGSIRR
jgi:hypothetical protein